jgi:uncharacterized coiled-coil protein SlyX
MDRAHRGTLLLAASLCLLPATASGASQDPEIEALRSELARTKEQLAATQETLGRVVERLDQLEARPAAPTAAAASGPRIPPVNADNPALSFVVDTTAQVDTESSGWNFALRSGELFLSAPIDPFLRGFATINGSSESGFDIEEAAVVTTSLPWNLTLKGGRFFADVGRLPHWHDEALPFVDRPPSIDRLIGGESQAEGVEATWLAPTDRYISVTTGLYNTIGADRNEALRDAGFDGRRSFNELTWLVHPATYFDLTDTLNLELGASFVTVSKNSDRYLYGFDATLRHQPGTSRFYQGFTLGTEWLWNQERFDDVEVGVDASGAPILGSERFRRNGGYAYLEGYFGRRYAFGLRGDYSEAPFGPADVQRTYSAYATWYPSEFQRLRFQIDQIDAQNAPDDTRFTVQWTAFMGSHSHGFTTR